MHLLAQEGMMPISCPRCLAPLAAGEVHDGQEDCDAAQGPTEYNRVNFPHERPLLPSDVSRGKPKLLTVAIDQVLTESNVRSDLGELEELAASVKSEGLLQPIAVHVSHSLGPRDLYVVDHGHRRLAACRLAGLETIDVIVSPAREGVDRPIAQLVENIQRADLNPLEEAKALRAILEADPMMTQHELALRVGRSDPWVSNTLGLLTTAPEVQALVAAGHLSGAHAKAIAGLEPVRQVVLAQSAVRDGKSAHALEEQATAERAGVETKVQRATSKPATVESSSARVAPIACPTNARPGLVAGQARAVSSGPRIRRWRRLRRWMRAWAASEQARLDHNGDGR
jgi:ParB family chromosome partitioning protein